MVMNKRKPVKYDLKHDNPVNYWTMVGLFGGATALFVVCSVLSATSGQEITFFSFWVFVILAAFCAIWFLLLITRTYERIYGKYHKWFDSWGIAIPNVLIGGAIMVGAIWNMIVSEYSWEGFYASIIGLAWVVMSIIAAIIRNKE